MLLLLVECGELNKNADDGSIMSKKERMEWLSRVVTPPMCEVDEQSDLCQEMVSSDQGVKMKMPRKIDTIRELNRMDGAYELEKIEVKSEFSFGSLLRDLPSDPLVR